MVCTVNHLFHTTALLTNLFSIYQLYSLEVPILVKQFKKFDVGNSKYLTSWNLIVQAVFFFICLLNDWFGTNAVSPKKPPFIRKLKDYVHAIMGFPIAMFVATVFWTLYTVDRELVFPKTLDPYFPWWLNHLMHTAIMVTMVIETIISPRKYPKRSLGILYNTTFMMTYLIWMFIIYYKSGVWVYPIFHVLNIPMRTLFLIAIFVFNMVLYIIGESLDNFFWGNEYIKHEKSHAKSK